MARMKKTEVIAALRAKGLEIAVNDTYNHLVAMLKAACKVEPENQATPEPIPESNKLFDSKKKITNGLQFLKGEEVVFQVSNALYKRASKKVGLSDEQIVTYTDAHALKAALNVMSPKTNPDIKIKAVTVGEQQKAEAKKMPKMISIESKIEVKMLSQNRSQFDEQTLQAELRRINLVYGTQKPIKIVKTVDFDIVKGITKDKLAAKFMVTTFEIYFKK